MEFEKILAPLQKLLHENEIIARCELLLRIYDAVLAADLGKQEADELKKLVGDRIAPGIFASIMDKEPVFFELPRLDAYTQMNGRVFHFLHTKRHSKKDFDDARRRFLQSLPELRVILKRSLTILLKDFMTEAGYVLVEENLQELVFSAGERTARATVFTSIRSVDLARFEPALDSGPDRIVLVPSRESLEPFMQFYREKGREAEEKGIQIWLANLEKGIIDPFIGYATDMDIYRQFKNPRLAEMVRNNWSPGPQPT